MKKKLAYVLACCLTFVMLGYGVLAYANPTGAAPSKEASGVVNSLSDGKLVVTTDEGQSEYPLAESVWVYRDNKKASIEDLKPGDKIEIIFNTKKQAAYLKVTSEDVQPAPTASPSPSATPTASPSVSPSAVPSATPAPTASAAPTATPAPSAAPEEEMTTKTARPGIIWTSVLRAIPSS
ncbi:hypothetical protein N6H14_08045 [Paenibacillus sp. CC-CFT747]|nr:hypothetical protein N6H14_08045 [Paenibacillus sp. CC-CFT747]